MEDRGIHKVFMTERKTLSVSDVIDVDSFFLTAILTGMFLAGVYDLILIFRNIIKHKNIFVSIEDFIYWNFVGIFLYIVIFVSNSGI